ncbi:hypothetical protein PAPHI01_0307 [Pancytospora philotis]|nr:hypothetical protein PAPHI01_0307 [Pancytospora philotis]
MLSDYIFSVIRDRSAAVRCAMVVERMGIPNEACALAVKIYQRLHELAKQTDRLYVSKKEVKSYFLKTRARLFGARRPPRTGAPALSDHSYMSGGRRMALPDIVRNAYLLFVMCCVVAYKYKKDISYTNDSWLGFVEVDCTEINGIERVILACLEYRLDLDGETEALAEMAPYLAGVAAPVYVEEKKIQRKRKIFCL